MSHFPGGVSSHSSRYFTTLHQVLQFSEVCKRLFICLLSSLKVPAQPFNKIESWISVGLNAASWFLFFPSNSAADVGFCPLLNNLSHCRGVNMSRERAGVAAEFSSNCFIQSTEQFSLKVSASLVWKRLFNPPQINGGQQSFLYDHCWCFSLLGTVNTQDQHNAQTSAFINDVNAVMKVVNFFWQQDQKHQRKHF